MSNITLAPKLKLLQTALYLKLTASPTSGDGLMVFAEGPSGRHTGGVGVAALPGNGVA